MDKKKLVVIGANDFQNQLIEKAKNRGMETHVFAWQCGDIGEKTADFFYAISITEKERILEKCKEIQPDGITSIASDLAMITVNYVAEKMGLLGNGIKSSLLTTNKYFMREIFWEHNIPSPKFFRSDHLSENRVQELHLPVIVKPTDRSGSRGVTKIDNLLQLKEAILKAESISFEKKAVVEEYIVGKEYSVEYISYKGQHTFLALTEKFTTGSPHFIETGHMEPAEISENLLEKIKKTVEEALDILMIKNGASHSEIKIEDSGEIKIIEIGGRMGGDCIGSDLVQLSTGYDYVNMVIDIACGKAPSFKKIGQPKKAWVRFLFDVQDLEELEDRKKKKIESIYRISKIEEIQGSDFVTDSSTRYGYYIFFE